MTDKKTPQKPKKTAARKPRAAASDSSKAKPSRAKSSTAKPSKSKAAAPKRKKTAKPAAKSSTSKAPAASPEKEAKPRAKIPRKKPVPKYIDDAIERALARSRGESRVYEFEQIEDFVEEDKRESAKADFTLYLKARLDEEEAEKARIEEAKREKIRLDLLEGDGDDDAEKTKGKGGRPKALTPELKIDLLVEIMMGRTVLEICEEERFPARSTVYRELALDSEFSDSYARAHEVKADEMFDGMVQIIDDCPADKGAIMKAREQLAARRYYLAKTMPDKYGPKSTITVVGSNRIAPIDDHDGVEEAREKYENARDFEF